MPLRPKFHVTFQFKASGTRTHKTSVVTAVKKALADVPRTALTALDPELSYGVHVTIVGQTEMHQLNLRFRKKDRPTDVLSFARTEAPGFRSRKPDLGDVILCLPVAEEQAERYDATLAEELQRLAVHGTLHLLGYDHEKNEREAKRMFRLQNKILKSIRG